jgi:cardiolipin synthase A/B
MHIESLRLLLDVLTILNIFFALTVVLKERKSPSVTWAWLLVVLVIPYIGFILYVLLGLDIRKNKMFLDKMNEDRILYMKYAIICNENKKIESHIQQLNCKNHSLIANDFNSVKLYNDGNDKFTALLKDIKEAKQFIHLQYFIVREDSLSEKIVELLTNKLHEGVEVRFLIDGVSCLWRSKKIFGKFLKQGGKLGIFLPPSFRLNFRNHRKIAIIDGQIGYLGGLNIGNEYLGQVEKFGYWRDMHMRLTGDIVKELNIRYIMDWNFTSNDKINISRFYFPEIDNCCRKLKINIISSGPDTRWFSILNEYIKMITGAKKYIYIQTPYFIPNESVLECLRISALSGVDVRIMIPSIPDHPFVYWANISYLSELLKCGVKCYKYKKGFLHSKVVAVDDSIVSIGTANMDYRSLKLNFEVNAFIYDEQTTRKVVELFYLDLQESHEFTEIEFEKIGEINKFKQSIARLLSPLM